MSNKFLNANRGGTVNIAAITEEVSRKVEATNAIALNSKADKLQSPTGSVLLESTADGSYKETSKNILNKDQTDTIVTNAKIELTSKIAESETRQETRTYSKADVDNKLKGKLDFIGGPKEGGLIPMQSDQHNGLVLSQYKFSDLIGKKISGYSSSSKVLVSGASADEIIESSIDISTLSQPIYYKYTLYSSRVNQDDLYRNISKIFFVSPSDTMTIKYITFNSDGRLTHYNLQIQDRLIKDTTIASDVAIITEPNTILQNYQAPQNTSFVWETNIRLDKEQTWNIKIPNVEKDVLVEIWYVLY